jgi:hypothetical protein
MKYLAGFPKNISRCKKQESAKTNRASRGFFVLFVPFLK